MYQFGQESIQRSGCVIVLFGKWENRFFAESTKKQILGNASNVGSFFKYLVDVGQLVLLEIGKASNRHGWVP